MTFGSKEEAEQAREALNGADIAGQQIKVKTGNKKENREKGRKSKKERKSKKKG